MKKALKLVRLRDCSGKTDLWVESMWTGEIVRLREFWKIFRLIHDFYALS